MNRSSKVIVTLLLASAGLAGAYAVGLRVGHTQGKVGFAAALASTQVELGVNKLHRLREFESDLSRGCAKEALAKVKFEIHTQLYVLSSFYQKYEGTWVVQDLVKQDPRIAEELRNFKQQYQSWTEPKCAA